MMTLLSPASLWTLAALALPLALHLWRRPPRTVRLGSLRFLQGHSRRLQNLRWREHALLFTRLCLLTALALALARPLWRQSPLTRPQRWALLDPAAAPGGPALGRLRALQSAGVETRRLAPGFPTITAAAPADPAAPASDLWSLLREADATLPAGSSLTVFSPGRLASLHGLRPALAHVQVEWIDTPSLPPIASTPPLPPAVPLTVLILHDPDRYEDARYLAAAWRAVSQTDGRPLTLSVASTTATPASTPTADWLFWLGDQPVPPLVAAHATNIFEDAPAPPTADTPPGWIIPTPGTVASDAPVRLWQRVPPIEGSVVWTDAFGQPLLTRHADAHGTRWHFASRFDPAWNDLPLGPTLPASLRALLDADAAAAPASDHDPRLADPSQCLPSDTTTAVAATALSLPGAETDGRPLLWLLAALLFCLERFLSHRRPPRFPAVATPPLVPAPALSR